MSLFIGFGSAAVSGVLDGSFAMPMKFARKWAWENIWAIFSLVCLIIFPMTIAMIFAPGLFGIYAQVEPAVLLRTFLFGAGWGVMALLYTWWACLWVLQS